MLFLFLIALALGALLAFARFGWWWGGRYESHFAVAQSVLSVAAIAGAAAWYFIARPDAAKLEFEQTITPVAMADGKSALLLAEVSLGNVGAQTLHLDDVPARLFVQQITPLSKQVADEYQPDYQLNQERRIRTADTWRYLARLETPIDSEIEAQEVENLYYRVIVPCQPNLRIYWTTWVEKPRPLLDRLLGTDTVWWIKQTYVDLTPICGPMTATLLAVATPPPPRVKRKAGRR